MTRAITSQATFIEHALRARHCTKHSNTKYVLSYLIPIKNIITNLKRCFCPFYRLGNRIRSKAEVEFGVQGVYGRSAPVKGKGRRQNGAEGEVELWCSLKEASSGALEPEYCLTECPTLG